MRNASCGKTSRLTLTLARNHSIIRNHSHSLIRIPIPSATCRGGWRCWSAPGSRC